MRAPLIPLALHVVLLLFGSPSARADGPAEVSFAREIAPILVKSCLACHGPEAAESDYQLHTFEALLKPGLTEAPPIVAGEPEESELLWLIASEDEAERMPKDADPLPPEQVALLRRWIEQGAKFDGDSPTQPLASLIPKAAHPQPPEEYRVAVPITALAFDPEGKELAVGGYHEITVWDPSDGQLLRRIKNIAQRTYGLAYSPDGKLLAAASGNPGQLGEVKLIDRSTGETVKDLVTLTDVALDAAFSPQGEKLAACGADRSVRIFDVATGEQEQLVEDHADWVMAIAWSPDGTQLATASRDKTAKVINAKTGESLTTYPGYGEQAYGVAFAPDGKQIFTSGRARSIHVWNPENGERVADIGGFGNEVYKLIATGGQLYTVSADKTARQFKADDRSEQRKFSGHDEWVYSLAVSPATHRLATGAFDGEVRIWNTDDGSLVRTFTAAPGAEGASPAAP